MFLFLLCFNLNLKLLVTQSKIFSSFVRLVIWYHSLEHSPPLLPAPAPATASPTKLYIFVNSHCDTLNALYLTKFSWGAFGPTYQVNDIFKDNKKKKKKKKKKSSFIPLLFTVSKLYYTYYHLRLLMMVCVVLIWFLLIIL